MIRVTCGRCGYKQYVCQCGSSQRDNEFRTDMRLVRDDHGLRTLVAGLWERPRPQTLTEACGAS